MTASMQGLEQIQKVLERYDRRFGKERQALIVEASKKAFVPDMKTRALASPGKAGPIMSRAVRARKGRSGVVLVGPKRSLAVSKLAGQAAMAARPGMDKKSWNGLPIAQFFVAGSKPHSIGAGRIGGEKTYYSEARRLREQDWKRTNGGFYTRTSSGRNRVALAMPGADRNVRLGPVPHPGIKANPFIDESAQAMRHIFVEELSKLMFNKGDQ